MEKKTVIYKKGTIYHYNNEKLVYVVAQKVENVQENKRYDLNEFNKQINKKVW